MKNSTLFTRFSSIFTSTFKKNLISKNVYYFVFLLFLLFALSSNSSMNWLNLSLKKFQNWEWTEVNKNSEWEGRAGLQAINHKGKLYIMGGRTPLNPLIINVPGASKIWGDVWKSDDNGKSWTQILETDDNTHWAARAYFQAVNRGEYIYIIGGQNFNIIDNPGFPFCTPCPPKIAKSDFFNDVWKSKDGKNWECLTKKAPWAPRAGGVAVVKNGFIYMIGGEDGFICNQFTPRCPPYYNDVWRTKDGKNWENITQNAQWSPRPGHQVVVADNYFVLFGGFGLDPNFDPINNPQHKYVPSNPMDVWVSKDGKDWGVLKNKPWNAASPADVKYDFDAVIVKGNNEYMPHAIYTFGGDRETFDFSDFTNYLNVDNDVWRFSLPKHFEVDKTITQNDSELPLEKLSLVKNFPNPFFNSTKITFRLSTDAIVKIAIYNIRGELVKNLISENRPAGLNEIEWDAKKGANFPVNKGIYIAKIMVGNEFKTIKMILN